MLVFSRFRIFVNTLTTMRTYNDMDYSEINVYQYQKFTLLSKKRGNRSFRFIRFDGNNYDEVVSFLTEKSPNTRAWPVERLVPGGLYTVSPRTFKFNQVFERDIRCVIASSPFLHKGARVVPLSLTNLEAMEYLKQNPQHRVFSYENILVAYTYDPSRSELLVWSYQHPKGMVAGSSLPAGQEWFIGAKDGIENLNFELRVNREDALHLVSCFFNTKDYADNIESLIYSINDTLARRKKRLVFKPSWEYYLRYQNLINECNSEHQFSVFVNTLYSILYEETKGKDPMSSELPSTGYTLGEFKQDDFYKTVGELRNYYDHGRSEYTIVWKNRKQSADSSFQKYLGHDLGPQSPEDYCILQMQLLNDFRDYLKKIDSYQKSSFTVSGIIMQDDNCNYYCGQVLLSKSAERYRGCEATIVNYKPNNNYYTQTQYQYYCPLPQTVNYQVTGIAQYDNKGVMFVDRYVFKDPNQSLLGKKVMVKKILCFMVPKDSTGYLGRILEWECLD